MSDLDSFFAKKDKKKGKTGKKFATTEEVAKKLEDITIKNKDKSKKDKVQSNNPDDSDNINEVRITRVLRGFLFLLPQFLFLVIPTYYIIFSKIRGFNPPKGTYFQTIHRFLHYLPS